MFWLSGWAGTGKPTIARTISREYYDKGRLGEIFFASFFFSSTGERDVSTASSFATSIAMQLAESPVLRNLIGEVISNDEGVINRILEDQWKQLIIKPLSKLNAESVGTPLILVIDALDECAEETQIRRVIQLLANARALKTVCMRVLITSRPGTAIRNGFLEVQESLYQDYILHNIS